MDEGVFHDEIEIEDFDYDPEDDIFIYPCPCGDLFSISSEDLLCGEMVASCASCSLILKVIYDEDMIEEFVEEKKSTVKKKEESETASKEKILQS